VTKCGFSRPNGVLALIALTVLCWPGAWADAHINVRNASGFPSSTTVVGVNFTSTSDAVGVNFRVNFDPNKLQFVSAEPGNAAIAANKEVADDVPSSGVVSVVVFGVNNNVIPDGRLVNLLFIVKNTATVGQKLSLVGSNQASTDTGAQSIVTTISDGEITVTECTAPSAPANFTASDGTFGDRVKLSWNPANGASSYKLYRSNSNTFATATTLAVTTQTEFSDFGATAAALASSGGCGASSTLSFTTHYYWVVAQNSCGASDPVGADSGFRGASKAVSSQNTYEPVLPANALELGIAPDDTIAIRLRADAPITSVWGYVSAREFEDSRVEWVPVDPSDSRDGWAVYRPNGLWIPGEAVTLIAGGESHEGVTIGPLTAVFKVNGPGDASKPETGTIVAQPSYAEFDGKGLLAPDEDSDQAALLTLPNGAIPEFPAAISNPLHITPDGPYAHPHRVWIPIPDGVSADTVSVYYYQGGVDSGSWYRAENVDGWLADDSNLVLDLDGRSYLGFTVNHGGIAALGLSDTPSSVLAASLSPTGRAMTNLSENVLLLGAVLGILGVSQYRTSRRRQRAAAHAD